MLNSVPLESSSLWFFSTLDNSPSPNNSTCKWTKETKAQAWLHYERYHVNTHPHEEVLTDTHLWFDGAVHGWGAGLLDASAAEGLWAGRQRRVRDPVGDFMLQWRRSLCAHLIMLLHLTHTHTNQTTVTQHAVRLLLYFMLSTVGVRWMSCHYICLLMCCLII